MVTGVWVRVVGRAALGKGNSAVPADSQLPGGDTGPPGPPSSPASAASSSTVRHRHRPRDPEPAGRGLMGPPPWWDLSPALAVRLHLLASLSGGGLAWQAGDLRWPAGEGWAWGVLGAVRPGRCQCLACRVWCSW